MRDNRTGADREKHSRAAHVLVITAAVNGLGCSLLVSSRNCYTKSRLEIPTDVKPPVSEPVHGDPVTQSLELSPYVGVSFFDPLLDPRLPFDVGGGVEPITQAKRC